MSNDLTATLEQLLMKCEPPVLINYNPKTEKWGIVKETECEYELELYGNGNTIKEAVVDFIRIQKMYHEFQEELWTTAERYTGPADELD